MTAIAEPRPTCYRCFRPTSVCYCDDISPVNNRTHIVILQHPREQFHPLNTVRIAERSLKRVSVVRSSLRAASKSLERVITSKDPAILFPSEDAEDLAALSPERRPEEIIVLDGTWHHAKTLLRDVPALGRFRRVRFTPASPSEYRIRKEPKEDYLSTVESIAHVLRLQEPDTPNIEGLREAFRRMIEKNVVARVPAQEGQRVRTKGRKIGHRFVESVLRPRATLGGLYCEGTSRWPGPTKGRDKEPLVVYVEGAGAEGTQRILVRTRADPPARLLEQLGLSLGDFEREGLPRADAAQRVVECLGGRLPVVWNASSRQIAGELGMEVAPIVLKGPYCDWLLYQFRRGQRFGAPPDSALEASLLGRWGSLDDAVERHALGGVPSGAGRGIRRIWQTSALLSWYHEQASAHCGSVDN